MAQLDPAKLQADLGALKLIFVDETESTNTLAKELVKSQSDTLPFVVVAGHQSAGRGQQSNSWWSDEGSLTFSIAVQGSSHLPPNLMALHVANLVANSIESKLESIEMSLKWPNDLFVGRRKCGGILIESIQVQQTRVAIIGIGINVNCDLSQATSEVRELATSLNEHCSHSIDTNTLLSSICNKIESELASADAACGQIVSDFLQRSLLTKGSLTKIQLRDGQIAEGKFDGIGKDGELIIDDGKQKLITVAATIIDYQIV